MKNTYKRENKRLLIAILTGTFLNILHVLLFWKRVKLSLYSLIPFGFMLMLSLVYFIAWRDKNNPMYIKHSTDSYFSHFTPEYAKTFYIDFTLLSSTVPCFIPSVFLITTANNKVLAVLLPFIPWSIVYFTLTFRIALGIDKDKKKRLKELDAQREKERIEQEKREREGKFK